ncbi:MAG TPA: transporter [Calidithermus sp.]|nr:transporter [Calidithermus sp.]
MRATVRPPALLVTLVVLLAAPCSSARARDIETDRPDVTESPGTVPPGAVQVETGVALGRESRGGRPDERRFAVEAALRTGLGERAELRLQGEPFVRLRAEGEDRGPGDVEVAVKYRMLDGDEHRPAVAVLGSVTLPVAEEPIGPERPAFVGLGIVLVPLPGDAGLLLNAGAAAVGQTRPSGYLIQGFGSVEVQAPLLPRRLEAYGELFGLTREERQGRGRVGLGAGLIYRITPRLAADAGVETTVAGAGPEWVVRAGLSARLPR